MDDREFKEHADEILREILLKIGPAATVAVIKMLIDTAIKLASEGGSD